MFELIGIVSAIGLLGASALGVGFSTAPASAPTKTRTSSEHFGSE